MNSKKVEFSSLHRRSGRQTYSHKPTTEFWITVFNYKQFFSIVLLAVVDANYKFLYVDIGQYGRLSDGGVFNNCALSSLLSDNRLNVPQATAIKDTDTVLPYVIVADDAFGLRPNLLKPYAFRKCTAEQRVFNYRLSRARRVVESAFGILSQRFLVFNPHIPTFLLHPFVTTRGGGKISPERLFLISPEHLVRF
jgi:hypothetical protein